MPEKKALDTRIYVLDTNILLHEPLAFLSFKEHDVVVPMTVLEELDYIKDSKKTLLVMLACRFALWKICYMTPRQSNSWKALPCRE